MTVNNLSIACPNLLGATWFVSFSDYDCFSYDIVIPSLNRLPSLHFSSLTSQIQGFTIGSTKMYGLVCISRGHLAVAGVYLTAWMLNNFSRPWNWNTAEYSSCIEIRHFFLSPRLFFCFTQIHDGITHTASDGIHSILLLTLLAYICIHYRFSLLCKSRANLFTHSRCSACRSICFAMD